MENNKESEHISNKDIIKYTILPHGEFMYHTYFSPLLKEFSWLKCLSETSDIGQLEKLFKDNVRKDPRLTNFEKNVVCSFFMNQLLVFKSFDSWGNEKKDPMSLLWFACDNAMQKVSVMIAQDVFWTSKTVADMFQDEDIGDIEPYQFYIPLPQILAKIGYRSAWNISNINKDISYEQVIWKMQDKILSVVTQNLFESFDDRNVIKQTFIELCKEDSITLNKLLNSQVILLDRWSRKNTLHNRLIIKALNRILLHKSQMLSDMYTPLFNQSTEDLWVLSDYKNLYWDYVERSYDIKESELVDFIDIEIRRYFIEQENFVPDKKLLNELLYLARYLPNSFSKEKRIEVGKNRKSQRDAWDDSTIFNYHKHIQYVLHISPNLVHSDYFRLFELYLHNRLRTWWDLGVFGDR